MNRHHDRGRIGRAGSAGRSTFAAVAAGGGIVLALTIPRAGGEPGSDAAVLLSQRLEVAGTPRFSTSDDSVTERFLLRLSSPEAGMIAYAHRDGEVVQLVLTDAASGACLLYARPSLQLTVSGELPGVIEALTGAGFSIDLSTETIGLKGSGSLNISQVGSTAVRGDADFRIDVPLRGVREFPRDRLVVRRRETHGHELFHAFLEDGSARWSLAFDDESGRPAASLFEIRPGGDVATFDALRHGKGSVVVLCEGDATPALAPLSIEDLRRAGLDLRFTNGLLVAATLEEKYEPHAHHRDILSLDSTIRDLARVMSGLNPESWNDDQRRASREMRTCLTEAGWPLGADPDWLGALRDEPWPEPGAEPTELPRPPSPDEGFVFPPGVDAFVIPMTRWGSEGHCGAVEVSVNGIPAGLFLVDTGAERTVIDRAFAQRHGLPWKRDPSSTLSETGGSQETVERWVDSLVVGGLPVAGEGVHVASAEIDLERDGSRIAGVLGSDLLGRNPFTFDLAAPTLVIHRRSRFTPPPGAAAVDLEIRDSRPHVALALFGEPAGEAMLDTGMDGHLSLAGATAARLADRLQGGRRWRTPIRGPSILTFHDSWRPEDDRRIPARMLGTDVRIPRLSMPLGESKGEAVSVLGMAAARSFALTFDYVGRRLFLVPVDSSGAGTDDGGRLDAALGEGDAATVGAILREKPSLATPARLQSAVIDGEPACARVLLETDPSLAREADALRAAATTAQADVVAMLLEHGADPAAGHGQALGMAIRADDPESVRLLVEAGAPPAIGEGEKSVPALTNALALRSVASALELVERGSPPRLLDLFFAAKLDDPDLVAALIDRFDSPPTGERLSGVTLLHAACIEGSPRVVGLLVERGWDVDAVTDGGESPLLVACLKGNDACAEVLLDHDADPTKADGQGRTPLIAAAFNGRMSIVARLLADPRVEVDAPATQGITALMMASQGGWVDVARLLLDAGADPAIADESGLQAVDFAAGALAATAKAKAEARAGNGTAPGGREPDSAATLGLLIAHGADWTTARGEAEAPLVQMLEHRSCAPLASELLAGASALPPDLLTPALLRAAKFGNTRAVERLVALGADPDSRAGTTGLTSLNQAAVNDQPLAIAVLLSLGADPNLAQGCGHAPLHHAAIAGDPNLLEVLVAGGADVDAADLDGMTPLMQAVKLRFLNASATLLAGGADPGAKDAIGRTAMDLATFSSPKAPAIVALLEEAGAER